MKQNKIFINKFLLSKIQKSFFCQRCRELTGPKMPRGKIGLITLVFGAFLSYNTNMSPFKTIFQKTVSLFTLLLLAGLPLAAQPLRLPTETRTLSVQDILAQFFRQKQAAAVQNSTTYRQRYSALAFTVYPRVFYEDKIQGLPPFDKAGVFFATALESTYQDLRAAKPADTLRLAQHMVTQVLRSPRRAVQLKNVPVPQVGDVWYQAFYLSSFYAQLGDYAARVYQENAAYRQYQKYLKAGDHFMAQDYAKRDFSLAKKAYDPVVFVKRQKEIEAFITRYEQFSTNVVRSSLMPLQAQKIPGADLKKYVQRHLAPQAAFWTDLQAALLKGLPAAQDFYQEAQRLEPSLSARLVSLAKMVSPTLSATKQDLMNSLRMFDYISVGLLAERLMEYDRVPSHEELVEELAAALAANALNERIAQVANDLFEFEKPFYYAEHSFGGAEQAIAQSWHNIATHPMYASSRVAEIAGTDLLYSGRWTGQTGQLHQTMTNRQAVQNARFYQKSLPLVIDFAAGDAMFALATPLIKGAKLLSKVQADDVARALSGTSKTAQGSAKAATVAQKAAAQADDVLRRAASAQRVAGEGFENAVWKLKDASGQTIGFYKVGTQAEIQRTKWLDQLVQKMKGKFDLLDVDYPRVIAEGSEGLSETIQGQVRATLNDDMFQYYVREFRTRVKDPFTLSPVDPTGLNFMESGIRPNPEAIARDLNGIPMSKAEWGQVKGLFEELNKEGFQHGDLLHNLYLKRQPNGKLKLTMLDFELSGNGSRDMALLNKWEEVLSHWGGIE